MKKLFSVAICAAMIGWAGSAMAITYTNTVDLNNITISEGIISGILYSDTASYSHATPSDFEVPYDIVNSATLTIKGKRIDGSNDNVYAEGVYVGVLNSVGIFSWTKSTTTTLDIAAAFSSWPNGNGLDIIIDANGFLEGILQLCSSTFTLDYTNASAPVVSSPVPEPATMLLFGTGIIGLAGIARRKTVHKA